MKIIKMTIHVVYKIFRDGIKVEFMKGKNIKVVLQFIGKASVSNTEGLMMLAIKNVIVE